MFYPVLSTMVALTSVISIRSYEFYVKKETKSLPDEKRKSIEEQIKSLANKLGVTKEIELIEDENDIAQAFGNAILPGKAVIGVNSQFFLNLSAEMVEFTLAHEICHIKHNDNLTTPSVLILTCLVTTIALSLLFPCSAFFSLELAGNLVVSLVVGLVAMVILGQRQEELADKTAFPICSEKGKIGAIIFFEASLSANIKDRNEMGISWMSSLWRKIIIDSDGENRNDLIHPPLKTRINYLQKLMTQNQKA